MAPLFTAGTRPGSLQNESGIYLTDFTVKTTRTYDDVMGVPNAGSVPATLYSEGYDPKAEIAIVGQPIPTSSGALQGFAALDDAEVVALSLANLIDNELLGIEITVGTLQSRDPEAKKARSGTGREFTFNLLHCPQMV
jgi:hypothetical protein